jgi:hypothetical protein
MSFLWRIPGFGSKVIVDLHHINVNYISGLDIYTIYQSLHEDYLYSPNIVFV